MDKKQTSFARASRTKVTPSLRATPPGRGQPRVHGHRRPALVCSLLNSPVDLPSPMRCHFVNHLKGLKRQYHIQHSTLRNERPIILYVSSLLLANAAAASMGWHIILEFATRHWASHSLVDSVRGRIDMPVRWIFDHRHTIRLRRYNFLREKVIKHRWISFPC
jgi:hypothetical protein